MLFYTHHYRGRVLWFHVGRPCVCPSVVRPSVSVRFQMITCVNVSGFSPNLVCALILWRSGLGLLMGKFCQILTEFSAQDMPIFSFTDDNLSIIVKGFSPNLVHALIWNTSGLGLLLDKFRQCLTRVIWPWHDWLGIIVKRFYCCLYFFYTWPHDSGGVLWFHIGRPCVHVSICLSVVCLTYNLSVRFLFLDDNLNKDQWIFAKLGMWIDIVEIGFGIANGQISSFSYGVTCL